MTVLLTASLMNVVRISLILLIPIRNSVLLLMIPMPEVSVTIGSLMRLLVLTEIKHCFFRKHLAMTYVVILATNVCSFFMEKLHEMAKEH